MRNATYISVVGPAEPPAHLYAHATELGRLLADASAIVVCGGLGGIMEAVAKGAAERDGVVVGLLPTLDRASANPFLTVAIPTGLGELRNGLVVRSGNAVIAIGGSWGTMSEVALALRAGLPVILLESWDVVDATGADITGGIRVESPAQAVAAALAAAHHNETQ
jgi:uncharacterized protein (TIGR00725 family)